MKALIQYDKVPVTVVHAIEKQTESRRDLASKLREKLKGIGLNLLRWQLKEISVF